MSKSFKELLSRIYPYKSEASVAIICLILESIFALISIPLLIPFFDILFGGEPTIIGKEALNEGFISKVKYYFSDYILSHSKEKTLFYLCLFIVFVFLVKNIFRYAALYVMAGIRNNVVADLRSMLYNKYLSLPVHYFQDERKGDLMTRMTSDVQEVEHSILQFLVVSFQSPIMILGCIAYMLYVNPSLTLFVFVLLLFTAVIIGSISRTLKRESTEVQNDLGRLNSVLEESISGMPVIKSYNAYPYWKDKFETVNKQFKRRLNALLRRKDLSSPMSEFLGICVVAILMYFGAFKVFNGEMSSAVFFSFIFAFYQVINPSKSFANAYYSIQKGMGAMDRINAVLQIEEEHHFTDKLSREINFKNSISIKNLTFSYVEGTEVLKDINITIPKGKKIAFVGASGSGKSTLMKLLLYFYTNYSGEILIDGVELRNLDPTIWRSITSWVTQDAFLFHESVLENIRFGRNSYNNEAVSKAGKSAFADPFVSNLEAGYETKVGEQGSKFSGGEKQRINIARALLSNPQVIMMDEPTSALDPNSEKIVAEALDSAVKDRTAIIVAHRLSTIKDADIIFVFDQGRIVDKGNHESLSQQSKIYREFIKIQNIS